MNKPFESIPNKIINSFDIDGVIYMGKFGGVYPGPSDIIITGRSDEEMVETIEMLQFKGIDNPLYMNPLPYSQKSRVSSGQHKGRTLFYLESIGYRFGCHFEDDPIQAHEINKIMPHIHVVMLNHNLVEKENVRRDDWKLETV